MVKSHGKKLWRAEGPKNAGWYSRITSSKLRTMHAKKEQIRQKLQEVPMDKELLSNLRT